MKKLILLSALTIVPPAQSWAVDLYGATPTAHSISLSGIYFGSQGPTDALASNPAALSFTSIPTLELTAVTVFSGGRFSNSTPYQGSLNNGPGLTGSAGFGTLVPGTHLHVGVGFFPTAMLAGKWQYEDPAGTAGVSYGLQTNRSAFIALQSSIGAAYDISSRFTVGASFGIINNLNTLETPYIFQQNPTLAGLKALLHLHTTGVGYNGTFGTIFKPSRSLEIGLSYKTRTTVRSTGLASGNMSALLQALGLSVQSTYHYQAEVDNVFPQSATAAIDWQTRHYAHLYLQADWINWRNAFTTLPVHLTNGDNPLLNTLLSSSSLNDAVPLHWRNQVAIRTGFSLPIRESFTLEGGYAHTTDPVPSGTLTPLTAAIMRDSVSTGLQYRKNRYRVQLGYQVNLPTTDSVGTSQLLAGEYDNTRTRLWLQTLALTTGIRF